MTTLTKAIVIAAALFAVSNPSFSQDAKPIDWENLSEAARVTEPLEPSEPYEPYYDECCGYAQYCDRYCPPADESVWETIPETDENWLPAETPRDAETLSQDHEDLIRSIYE